MRSALRTVNSEWRSDGSTSGSQVKLSTLEPTDDDKETLCGCLRVSRVQQSHERSNLSHRVMIIVNQELVIARRLLPNTGEGEALVKLEQNAILDSLGVKIAAMRNAFDAAVTLLRIETFVLNRPLS